MNNAWYENRDKRTDGCDGVKNSYKDSVIHIQVFENPQEHRVQMIVYFTLKILAKWCRNIRLTIPDAHCRISKQNEHFLTFIKSEISEVDPYCIFEINPEKQSHPADINLLIGHPTEEVSFDYVSASAYGWIAACGFNQIVEIVNSGDNELFIGPAFAACLANTELFRYLIGEKAYPYKKWYSLFTNEIFETIPQEAEFNIPLTQVDFGRVHLVGCGAIGSSFAFLFPYSQCTADFLLIDPDAIEDHNTSSSLLFTYDDAHSKHIKVDVCANYLSKGGIQNATFHDEYGKFDYDHESKDLKAADVILCFANEHDIWSTIQYLYPPLCFHATTSKSWGIHIGRHVPLIDNCIMCTFKDLIKVNFTPICAEAEIKTNTTEAKEERHTAILPFLAPAAAIVTFCELFKAVSGIQKKENTIVFNMQSSEGLFISEQGEFGSCFICKSQTESLYHQFGKNTKFWKLSQIT